MTLILAVAMIAVVIALLVLNDKLNELRFENIQLKQQLSQLWSKFEQHMQNHSYVNEQPEVSPTQKEAAAPPVMSVAAANPETAQEIKERPQTQKEAPSPAAAFISSPSTAHTYSAPSKPETVVKPVSPKPPEAEAKKKADVKENGTPGRMENWFGRNVLGIAASVLFFIGLIVFAIWIYDDIPETVKIILMYGISAGITAAGIFLTKRRRNTFTLILSGCGCGLLFISILLTYIYFGRFNDIATFSLLLVWLIASLLLSKFINSTLISIVAHVGMGVSLCFAYAAGLQDNKLIMLLIYQAASIAVILIGNLLCCKKTYRFGLFLSVVVTLLAGNFMGTRFIGASPLSDGAFPRTGLPDWGVALSFFGQFLCVSFLCYLLSVSTTRLKNAAIQTAVHIAGKILWGTALCTHVLTIVYRLGYAYTQNPVAAAWIMAAVGSTLLLIHSLLSLFMGSCLQFKRRLETISVVCSGSLSAFLLFLAWKDSLTYAAPEPRLPLILLPSLFLIWAGIRRKSKAYLFTANILLGLEWILMAIFGFHELTRFGTIALPLFYMAVYVGLLWLQWKSRAPEEKEKVFLPLRIFTYFFLQITALIILLGSGYRYWGSALLLSLALFHILLGVFQYHKNTDSVLDDCKKIVEILLLSINAAVIAFAPRRDGVDLALMIALSVFSVVYAFFRLPLTLGKAVPEDVYTGIKFTVLTLAILHGFTGWLKQDYLFTLTVTATAFICCCIGYWRTSRGLVHYGLIAAIICAFKLFYDLFVSDSLTGLIAMLGNCALIFLMQLFYERFDDKENFSYSKLLYLLQHLLLAAAAYVIAFVPHHGVMATILSILLTLLSIAWAFLRTVKILGRSNRWEDVLEGIKLTVLVLAAVHGYTDWFQNAYVFSLICMLTALICVIAGFVRRSGSLRLYGLVLTMICVLKLVTWDVAGLETLLRILSLAGGGIICFAISAIYSYSVRHLSALISQKENEKPGAEL